MAFDQSTRNRLARFVTEVRTLLTDEFIRQLQHEYGLDPRTGEVTDLPKLGHLDDARRETAMLLRETMEHYLAGSDATGVKAGREALDRIVREQAFTVLNRLCALRLAEARGLLIESVARGYQSKGFQLFARLAGPALGETGDAYRVYLFSLFDEFAVDLPVLFDRFSPEGRLFPGEATLQAVLAEIDHRDLDPLWGEDETVGWIYQYFNSKEERKAMRDASAAPRNSRELAVRNQFFTPRYVVEFLTDNTLGRIWYEMTRGDTALKEQCRFLVRRPNEVFLRPGEAPPETPEQEDLSQEELLRQPVHIPHRPLKDPRDLKMLDPACGSMHFGLYAFDLFERIYEEAWRIEQDRGAGALLRSEGLKPLRDTYADRDAFLRDVPRLIVERNIHGIDIDPRAVQIAGLSLWLRAQRSWQRQDVTPQQRPQIQRSNIACAEPMPGEEAFLEEFVREHLCATSEQRLLGQLFLQIVEAMKLAGEAGSLLRIEEEIAGAVAAAKKQWLSGPGHGQGRLFTHDIALEKDSGFEVSGIGQEDFWEQAEERIYAALRLYSEDVGTNRGGYQRRLFANDAARGFAFIDLCRNRYEVVVMNPPFGLAPRRVYEYLQTAYPDTYVDLYGCVVARGVQLSPGGLIGAITSRAFLMTKKLARWRSNQLVPSIELILDLGSGVMDNAFVEAAAYTLRSSGSSDCILATDRRGYADKHQPLRVDGGEGVFLVRRSEILSLPEQKLLYQLPAEVFALLRDKSTFEPRIGTARDGMRTFDDFRFVRLRWEVAPACIGQDRVWEPLAKGGEYAQYYSDLHLLVKWNGDGRELAQVNIQVNGQVAQSRQASDYYRRNGATYSKRSVKGFSARALPSGCIIGTKGPAVLSESEVDPAYIVGWLNSSLVVALIHIQANAYEFNTGIIKRLPWRYPRDSQALVALTDCTIRKAREWRAAEEINSLFASSLGAAPSTMASQLEVLQREAREAGLECKAVWDDVMKEMYGVGTLEIDESVDDSDQAPEEESEEDEARVDLRLNSARAYASHLFGHAVGRWDIRYATGETPVRELPGPFVALPPCPPGQLQNEKGLPLTQEDVAGLEEKGRWDYPIEVPWAGVLVDDAGHSLDVEARVHGVQQSIWKDRWESIEREACDIIGVRTLRDYFRKPSGFFADHLRRYSKSRRQAPIYWPLSTPTGSYTLWIYYHRLTDQTLYTCVNDFVEPKLKQVAESTAGLRAKSGRSVTDERGLERLSALEAEVKDFRDELLRIARFWKPNLNDGVQITAAPLWKLFQHKPWQKKLRETWEKLEVGDYDWAHLAYSIWPERVREKCRTDKSLAIAHGLEEVYVEPKEKRASAMRKVGDLRHEN